MFKPRCKHDVNIYVNIQEGHFVCIILCAIFTSIAGLWIAFVTDKKKYHPKQTNFVACLVYERVIWQFNVQNKFGKEWTAISKTPLN